MGRQLDAQAFKGPRPDFEQFRIHRHSPAAFPVSPEELLIHSIGVKPMHDMPEAEQKTLICGGLDQSSFENLPVREVREVVEFVHVSVPLSSVVERLASQVAPVGVDLVGTAGSPGLVDFEEASACADRVSSPVDPASETTA